MYVYIHIGSGIYLQTLGGIGGCWLGAARWSLTHSVVLGV